jgi:hypothetical protein
VLSPVVSASCSSCSLARSHFQHRLRGRGSPDSDLVPTDGVGLLARGRIDAGVPVLRILLVGQVIAASAGSQMHVIAMTGHERAAAALLVAGRLLIPSRTPC